MNSAVVGCRADTERGVVTASIGLWFVATDDRGAIMTLSVSRENVDDGSEETRKGFLTQGRYAETTRT